MDAEVIVIDVGRSVFCDGCGDDYTDSSESGGIYGLTTKAFCPKCAPQVEADAIRYGESQHIRGRCPKDKSFADWVRDDLR